MKQINTYIIQNGLYILRISDKGGKGFISKELFKSITVDNKNIYNVIIFLEKECKVSGQIKFEDGTPIKNAMIEVRNDRSLSFSKTDQNGIFIASGLRESDDTMVKAIIPGFHPYLVVYIWIPS